MRIQQPGTTLMPQVCTICGAKYMGGPSALYCPSCREIKRREYERESRARQRAGRAIVLGETIGICEKCGEKFVYQGPRQKYCKKCADEAIRENDREKTRGWLRRTVKKHGRRYADERNAAKKVPPKHCKICGVSLAGMQANREYCDDCREVQIKYNNYVQDLKRRRAGKPLSFEEWRKVPRRRDSKEIIKEWREKNPDGTYKKCSAETGLCAQTIGKWWRIIDEEAGVERKTPYEIVKEWREQNPNETYKKCSAETGLCTQTIGKWWRILDDEAGVKRKTSYEIVKEWREKNPKGKKVACAAATGLNAVTVRKWWRVLEDEAGIKRETSRERIARWRKENPKGRGSECAAAIGLRRETVYKWWKIIDKEEQEDGK